LPTTAGQVPRSMVWARAPLYRSREVPRSIIRAIGEGTPPNGTRLGRCGRRQVLERESLRPEGATRYSPGQRPGIRAPMVCASNRRLFSQISQGVALGYRCHAPLERRGNSRGPCVDTQNRSQVGQAFLPARILQQAVKRACPGIEIAAFPAGIRFRLDPGGGLFIDLARFAGRLRRDLVLGEERLGFLAE
jgi:hypothetical protein